MATVAKKITRSHLEECGAAPPAHCEVLEGPDVEVLAAGEAVVVVEGRGADSDLECVQGHPPDVPAGVGEVDGVPARAKRGATISYTILVRY